MRWTNLLSDNRLAYLASHAIADALLRTKSRSEFPYILLSINLVTDFRSSIYDDALYDLKRLRSSSALTIVYTRAQDSISEDFKTKNLIANYARLTCMSSLMGF